MGMTIGEWRTLDPPAGEGANAFPNCWTVDRAGRISGRPLSVTAHATDIVVCAYDTRYGLTWSTHSFYLDPQVATVRVHDVRYVFTRRRLSEIDFSAPAAARTQVERFIAGECRAPARARRRGGRLIETWRAADCDVTLTDPSRDPVDLSVRMAGPGAPPPGFLRSALGRAGGR